MSEGESQATTVAAADAPAAADPSHVTEEPSKTEATPAIEEHAKEETSEENPAFTAEETTKEEAHKVKPAPAPGITVPAAPVDETKDAPQAAEEPTKEAAKTSPLQDLWTTAQSHAYKEIWGVTLQDPATHVPSQVVLQKYLNANDGDLVKAKDQLTKTLDWRAEMKPLELITQKYSKEKFGSLGYVTTYEGGEKEAGAREVLTWNVYGNVKSIDVTFGDLNEFIRWRVALMELAVQELHLSAATTPIGSDPDADPYKMFQVHDYKGVSFLRQAPQVKAASTETIRVFATAYPELLKEKFFVNVPAVMGFMYSFIKLFVAARTARKFHPMSNGGGLAKENFGGSKVPLGDKLPPEYGGKGADLKTQGKEPEVE
ncbi:CRAL-TRIO domain-containing protein [Xylariaceae sp. FL0255]|nr:CRAL-TRIO domain-containing protein [Xylariaceae sp. FL0255]